MEYCNGCLEFQPDVERPQQFYTGSEPYIVVENTVIKCENRDRCKRIKEYLEGVTKDENSR